MLVYNGEMSELGLRCFPEVFCYNNNYFELDVRSCDSWTGTKILFKECHEDENYCTYALGKFIDGEYGECFKDLLK